jgi:hypothetical protein
MHIVFILSAVGSLAIAASGFSDMANNQGSVEPAVRVAVGTMRLWMGLGGVAMSAALYCLYDDVHKTREQLKALNETVRQLQTQTDELPPR